MSVVRIVKNFLTAEECEALNNVANLGVKEGWLNKGKSRGQYGYKDRFTSRMHMENHEYPQIVLDISNKIRKFCNIDHYPIIDGHGKNGVVVSMTFNGGDTYEHCDPRNSNNDAAYRCNVLTQAPLGGGHLYVNGEKIVLNEGDLHCYFASEYKHYVTVTGGYKPRILWMFGAYIPKNNIFKYN